MARSDAVKTAIICEEISQECAFCTLFEVKLQTTLNVYMITKQCASYHAIDAILN